MQLILKPHILIYPLMIIYLTVEPLAYIYHYLIYHTSLTQTQYISLSQSLSPTILLSHPHIPDQYPSETFHPQPLLPIYFPTSKMLCSATHNYVITTSQSCTQKSLSLSFHHKTLSSFNTPAQLLFGQFQSNHLCFQNLFNNLCQHLYAQHSMPTQSIKQTQPYASFIKGFSSHPSNPLLSKQH